MHHADEGIWDDGEWISWDEINDHLEAQDLREQYPNADIDVVYIFEGLIDCAVRYHAITNRHLDIWGELGELFAEITYGLKRHKPKAAGSDGKIGNDFVEVKTISPFKGDDQVLVKRKGNFNKLIVVTITTDYAFEARMIARKDMPPGDGKFAKVRWRTMPSES